MSKELIILTVQLGNDGAERVLSLLTDQWIKAGIRVTVVQIHPSEYNSSYSVASETEIINLSDQYRTKIAWKAGSYFWLIRFFRKRKNATILSFTNTSTIVLYRMRPFISNRIVVAERNDPRQSPPRPRYRALRDKGFLKADVCVFQTHEAMNLFPKEVRNKGVVILNPINPNLPEPWTEKRRKVIVTAGRLTKQKNLSLLVNAFAKFYNTHSDYILEIYGQGEDEESLKTLCTSLNIEESVFFCGFVTDLHERIIDASMYVSSSDYEGIPNSVLEAMAMGIPTISTDCPVGGPREIIDESNGILVPVGNVDKLVEAMSKIADNYELAQSLGDNGYQTRKMFPIEKIAKEWETILFFE